MRFSRPECPKIDGFVYGKSPWRETKKGGKDMERKMDAEDERKQRRRNLFQCLGGGGIDAPAPGDMLPGDI